MRYHLTLVKWPSSKNLQTINVLALLMGVLTIQPLWSTVWRFLKTLKLKLPYYPAIPLLGIYAKKSIIQKVTCTPMFIVAPFT